MSQTILVTFICTDTGTTGASLFEVDDVNTPIENLGILERFELIEIEHYKEVNGKGVGIVTYDTRYGPDFVPVLAVGSIQVYRQHARSETPGVVFGI